MIYIVSTGLDTEQVFAHLEDAERFAGDNPEARISRHRVRRSVDEAVVIFDRRVVVAQGTTVLDRTDIVRKFVDDPHDTPVPADVEWFHDAVDSEWHIAGFGIDKAALDAQIQNAIDRFSQLSHASPIHGTMPTRPPGPLGRWSGWTRNSSYAAPRPMTTPRSPTA